ncbi:hypothetical protein BC943DRAFT_323072 [Umbelopsis sp. AD052]|nr:hypothetical protein BC943DRAFT_323072 [Umbelopsis sp. AD052]
MTSSALAEPPFPSTPMSMSFAVTPELSPLTTGRGGSTSIPLTPEIVEAGSPALSSKREDFHKRWQLFDARIEHRLDEVSSLLKPSTYYSEPTYATNLPLPHSTSAVPFNVSDENCLSLDELSRLSRSSKHSESLYPTRSRQGQANSDGASQSKKITLRSAKEIMAADKRTGTKEDHEPSKPKASGKTPEGQSDADHEASAMLEILNEIQSVGNSAAGANGKSASGTQKPSGLGLMSSVETSTKSSSTKVSTPTMPSSFKRSKTSSSEKLTNAPTPQLGSYGSMSPRLPKKDHSKSSDTSISRSKHSPPEPKIDFALLRTLLKDETQQDWSLPVIHGKSVKTHGARSASPPRNGVKSSKSDTKPTLKAAMAAIDTPGKRKSSKENISTTLPKDKMNGLPRPILRVHLALLPDFNPASNSKPEEAGESSKQTRDTSQPSATKKRKVKDAKKEAAETNVANSSMEVDLGESVELQTNISTQSVNATKHTSQDINNNEVEEGEALSTGSSPTVVAPGEKLTATSRSEVNSPKVSSHSKTKTYRSSSTSTSPDRKGSSRSKDQRSKSPSRRDKRRQRSRSSERRSKTEPRGSRSGSYDRGSKRNRRRSSSTVRRRSRTPERHRSRSSGGHRSKSVERRRGRSRSRSYERHSRSGSRDRRRSDSSEKLSDDRRTGSLRDKDRRRANQSHRRSRSRDWEHDATEAPSKPREDSKPSSSTKDRNRTVEPAASKIGSGSKLTTPAKPSAIHSTKTTTTVAPRKDNVEQLKVSSFMFRELALQYKRSADQSCQTQDGEPAGIAEYLHSIFNYILSYHFNDKFDTSENSFVRWENLQPLLKFVSQTLKKREEWHLYGLCMKVNALINFNAFRMRQTPVRRCMTKLHESIKSHSEATTAMSSEYIPQVEKLLNLHELANVQWDEGEMYFDWHAFQDRFPNTWKQVCVDGDFSKGTVFGEETADMKGPLFPMTPFSKLNHVAVMGKCIVSEWITAHNIHFQPISDPTAL